MKWIKILLIIVCCIFLSICEKRWKTERESIQISETISGAGFQIKLRQQQGILYSDPEKIVVEMAYAMLPTEKENSCFWRDYGELTQEQRVEFWKALIILSRTNLYKAWIDAEFPEKLEFPVDKLAITKEISGKETKDALSAQEKTQGIIICFDTEVKYLPYFFLSAGETRAGKICKDDKENDSYVTLEKKSKEEFLEELQENFAVSTMEFEWKRDNAMYVEEIEMQGMVLNVSEFQKIFQLPSPCFFVEEQGNQILFTTKGIGHGYGMSVNYALKLAKCGRSEEEILRYFFENIQLERKYGV